MRLIVLFMGLSLAAADNSVPSPPPSAVPCHTVGDCWLDADGTPIRRPKRFKGRALPRGDCGNRILWLRNQLACVEQRCVALFVGDRC